MAIQKVTDGLTIVQAAGDTYEGSAADQTYTISPTLTSAGDTIVIIDQGGSNTIELAGGLTIASSVCVADETQLTLSNGAIVNIRGADTFTFAVGANTAAGQTGQDKTFAEFATDVLRVTLPAAGEAAVTGDNAVSIEVGGNTTVDPTNPTPSDFTLTVADDEEVISGTGASETIDGTESGSLQSDDIILDSSTDDADVLNAVVTTSTTESRITNVETINLDGEFITTGFDFKNTSNAKVANLNTGIVGGTADVDGVNSLNVAKLVAGNNIATLDVTSLSSGTRDTVEVDAGSASTVKITGNSNGSDSYNVDVAKDAAVTLTTLDSSGDAVNLNLEGDIELVSLNANELDITIDSSAAAEVVLNKATPGGVAEKIFLTGSNDITLVSTNGLDLKGAALDAGTEVTSTSTGTTTIEVEELAAVVSTANNFGKAAVDVLELSKAAAGAAGLTLNQNTKLNLTEDQASVVTVALDNGDDDKAFTTGTLRVDISDTQSSALTTAGTVETLIVAATPDKTTDLDQDENGSNETTMTVADIALDTGTKVVVVNGDNDLVISDLSISANDQVLSASQLNGNLTLATLSGVFNATIVGGAGNDSVTTTVASVLDVQGGAGNDTINITGALADSEVTGGEGDDTVTSSANAVTIDLGAGSDTFNAAGSDTVTLGDGTDYINLTDQLSDVVINDFVKGTDVVTLTTGVATAAIDLSDITVVDGVYKVADTDGTLADNEWHIKLKNNDSNLTDTDMSDSFRAWGVTLLDTSTNTLGDIADYVKLAADESATINSGSGSDIVELAVGAATKATVKDFELGTDKIQMTGTITVDLDVNLTNVSDTAGVYTIGDATLGGQFKIENGGSDVVTENNLTNVVQLGTSVTSTILVTDDDNDSSFVNVTGGSFNDFVSLAVTGANIAGGTDDADDGTIYNFSNNGGVDTVVMAANNIAADASPTVVDAGFTYANFNNLTGIDSSVTGGKVDIAADAAKTGDAVDKAVYVFADSSNGAGTSKITTFVKHTANGYTQDAIDAEVAAFLDANMATSTGENYVVVINDKSSATYEGKDYGSQDSGSYEYDAYAYLVTGDADGIQADNITLIGMFDDAGGVAGNTVFTTADIA